MCVCVCVCVMSIASQKPFSNASNNSLDFAILWGVLSTNSTALSLHPH